MPITGTKKVIKQWNNWKWYGQMLSFVHWSTRIKSFRQLRDLFNNQVGMSLSSEELRRR